MEVCALGRVWVMDATAQGDSEVMSFGCLGSRSIDFNHGGWWPQYEGVANSKRRHDFRRRFYGKAYLSDDACATKSDLENSGLCGKLSRSCSG